MDHRIPPVWCHLMSLDFRLSLKFNHLINIITIARENGKNTKNKPLLKWIIMGKNSFIVHANRSDYDDRVWKALAENWCSDPFSVISTAILNRYADYHCTSVPDLPLLIISTKDVLNYSTTKHYNRFKMTM